MSLLLHKDIWELGDSSSPHGGFARDFFETPIWYYAGGGKALG